MPRIKSGWCPSCERRVAAQYSAIDPTFHVLMTVLTCGLYLPLGLAFAVSHHRYRCSRCGTTTSSVR